MIEVLDCSPRSTRDAPDRQRGAAGCRCPRAGARRRTARSPRLGQHALQQDLGEGAGRAARRRRSGCPGRVLEGPDEGVVAPGEPVRAVAERDLVDGRLAPPARRARAGVSSAGAAGRVLVAQARRAAQRRRAPLPANQRCCGTHAGEQLDRARDSAVPGSVMAGAGDQPQPEEVARARRDGSSPSSVTEGKPLPPKRSSSCAPGVAAAGRADAACGRLDRLLTQSTVSGSRRRTRRRRQCAGTPGWCRSRPGTARTRRARTPGAASGSGASRAASAAARSRGDLGLDVDVVVVVDEARDRPAGRACPGRRWRSPALRSGVHCIGVRTASRSSSQMLSPMPISSP